MKVGKWFRAAMIPILLIALSGSALATVRYVNPDGLCGGQTPCYTTIGAAITAAVAGDSVMVAAGTYAAPPTNPGINKSVTLHGADRTTTFITGAMYLTAAGITFEGFTVSGVGPGAYAVYAIANNITIQNCIVENNDVGIRSDGARSGLHILNNIVRNNSTSTSGTGGIYCSSAGPGLVISGNTVSYNYAQGIVVEVATGAQITNNQVSHTLHSNSWTTGSDIGLNSAIGGTISGNTVSSGHRIGILLFGTQNVTVQNNVVSGFTTEAGSAVFIGGGWGSPNATGNHVYNNVLTGNLIGVEQMSDGVVSVSGNVVYGNDLSGNSTKAINNELTSLMDASANWWGSNVAASVAASTTANVDFTPYLDNGTDTNVAIGFQGDFHTLDVTALGPQTGAVGRIQEGINLTTGSIVAVGAGVYHERLVLTSGMDLRGAQFGVDPTPGGARTNSALESVVDVVGLAVPNPDVLMEIPAGVTNVTVSGFTLIGGQSLPHNADQSAIRCWDDHITIQDNIIDGYTSVLYKGNDYFTANRNRITANNGCVIVQPSPATYVTISNNTMARGGSPTADCKPIYLTGDAHTVISGNVANGFPGYAALSGSNHTDVTVSGNTFAGDLKGVSFWGNTTFITISGNTLSNSVGGCGIEIKGQDITISGNAINGNSADGIKVDYHVIPTERVTIYNNSISGNGSYGLEVTPAVLQTVNASGNWWDSAAPNWATAVRGGVDYTPWMGLDGTYNNPGYTGNFHTLWVSAASLQTGPLIYIQEAVNMVTGSTINLVPGIYLGQVTVSAFPSVLNIVGTGTTRADVVIRGVASMTPFDSDRRAVLAIVGTTTVNVSHLTVDGNKQGNTNNRMFGVAYWNSGGSLTDCDVLNVEDNPFSGAQHGVGVYANNNDIGTFSLNLNNVLIDNFQKNGTAFVGMGLTVSLQDVIVIGEGPTTVTAQNGIQISYGATGTVNHCTVSGINYTGPTWAASGILLVNGGNSNITNGTSVSGSQTAVYAQDADGSFQNSSISGGTNGPIGVLAYNSADAKTASIRQPQVMPESNQRWHSDRNLDADQTFSVIGSTITGTGESGSVGVYGFSYGDNLTLTVNNCDVTRWENGVYVWEDGGTISPAIITGNRLSNTSNAWDNHGPLVAGRWASNCYSDYTGTPTYPIAGGPQFDATPNVNGCSNVDVYAPSYIGCAASGCPRDTLYYTLDLAGVVDGRVWLTLPAGFVADWSGATYPIYAGAAWDPRFVMGHATKLSGNQVEINVQFDLVSGGSTGNPALFFASLPIRNDTVGHCGHKVVSGDSTYFIMTDLTTRTDLFVAAATITVDCAAPTGTLAYEPSAPACNAFGAAAQLDGKFKTEVFRGDASCNAPLDEAWLTVNGYTYSFFGTNPSGDFSQVFPGTGTISAATLWSWLNPGCNTLVVHYKDTECNEDSVSLGNVGKDVTPPSLTVGWSQPLCYTNEPLSPYYGAGLIGTDLNINASLGSGCVAQTGMLWYTYGSDSGSTPYANLNVTGYPAPGVEANALWAFIVAKLGGSASGTFTFTVHVKDCSGNETSGNFNVCVDFVLPSNAFSFFDARPTGLGCWLKWSWTYNGIDADSAKIFRSPYVLNHYPEYNGAQTWDNFADDADYEMNYYQALTNWTLVAAQGSLVQTSGAHPGTHGGLSNDYWLYRDAAWDTVGPTDNEQRDIYRFVTFVRDASGNWSQVATTYAQGQNADRSTNYWLGDFTMDTDNDCPSDASSGAVEGADLAIFTASYFKGAHTGYQPRCDIGPETGYPQGENHVGKGIPMPDDSVNFWDMVPFSFNYYTTGFTTYSIQPVPTTPSFAGRLDEQPAVALCRANDQPINLRDEFTVVVSVSGNAQNEIKGLEAELVYDPEVMEFVASSPGDIAALSGELFGVTRPIDGTGNRVGMAAAALGPVSTLSGNFILATVTFRWIGERTASADIALGSVRMFDAYANVMNGAGTTLSVKADGIVPTRYALYQNYPNPFNPSTMIQFDVKQTGHVVLRVYNTLGQNVATVVNSTMEAGRHSVIFGAANLASGVYIYTIEVNGFSAQHKMVLMK